MGLVFAPVHVVIETLSQFVSGQVSVSSLVSILTLLILPSLMDVTIIHLVRLHVNRKNFPRETQ